MNKLNTIFRKKYRIKEVSVADLEHKCNYYFVYNVQVRLLPFIWLTIKSFVGKEDEWWAQANAQNLLDELNKEL